MPHHLPSPSSSASLSPRVPTLSRHHSCSDDDGDRAARSALEIRREKNRIKQRNLRLRRANQMADLESTVTTLRTDHHELEDRLAQLEAREANFTIWVRDLEAALIAQGQREQVEMLRRAFAPNVGAPISINAVNSEPLPPLPTPAHRSSDPLATLATAASSFSPPDRRWDDDSSSQRSKRRRYDEYDVAAATAAHGHGHGHHPRLPSPSRNHIRIDQLVLPIPRPSPSEPWNTWNSHSHSTGGGGSSSSSSSHSSIDQFHFDSGKPSSRSTATNAATAPDARAISPSDRRPMSASSSAGTAVWNSPVQSFDIRL